MEFLFLVSTKWLQDQFPLFSQKLVRQAQEKLDEIHTQLGSMRPVQLAVGTA